MFIQKARKLIWDIYVYTMSAYSAPERNTGAFIGFIPKKIFSTDHTHSGFGVGDVKKSGSNDFTGINSFSNETTFTHTNPITLKRWWFYDTKV